MRETRLIALAGNPNVGKSTVFNALTGMKQHTGNWPGKTVEAARGRCSLAGESFTLVDVPGAYSLWAQSAEEEAALEAVCFGGADAVVVVCDAACLERNLNLVYQVMEITDRVAVCVNLLDEAEKHGVRVDLDALSAHLGVPAVGCCAREKKGVNGVLEAAKAVMERPPRPQTARYPERIERAADALAVRLQTRLKGKVNARFSALRLMEGNPAFLRELKRRDAWDASVDAAAAQARAAAGGTPEEISAALASGIYAAAEEGVRKAVRRDQGRDNPQLRADRLLTGLWGVPVMAALLILVFFLTLKGADGPSAWLAQGFRALESCLAGILKRTGLPVFLRALLTEGVARTLGQVVSVMLPPMAVFFPLFALLEDSGYLPRVAFALDGMFEKCSACGKQALTMCMGLGCNAVGVTGCRIIDSPRERLMAILTNSMVPCNGRFPTLFAMMSLFWIGSGLKGALAAAGMAAGLGALSVGVTLLSCRMLSLTVLKGVPSSYTLELPAFRRPQVGRVILRSILDRTVFVLGRAATAAAPAGAVLFLLTHIRAGGAPLLSHVTAFLEPLGRLMGLDGVMLAAFLLGCPANEIVLPIAVMSYTSAGGMGESGGLASLGTVLHAQGWTALTGLNVALFSLFHFPCAATLATIHHETKSWKWTLAAFALPTLIGTVLCMTTAFFSKFV